jgi:hypothetical protein
VVQRRNPGPVHARCPLNAASDTSPTRKRFCRLRPSAEWFCERGRLTAVKTAPRQAAACAHEFQEMASWLSLATRSKASVELLMRY